MRRVHPLWRGFWLAVVLAAVLVLLGGTDDLAPYRLDRQALAFALMAAFGVLLTCLLGWLTRRKRLHRPRWRRCLTCFLAGLAMALSLGLAGTGRMLPALLEGSVGAIGFAVTAGLTGFITTRIMARRASR